MNYKKIYTEIFKYYGSLYIIYSMEVFYVKCEECGEEVEGNVCKNCGLVIDSHPILANNLGYTPRNMDITTLYSADFRSWEHPLSPNIRKAAKDFVPRYQKKYVDYIYVKAYESIKKLCAKLKLPNHILYESLHLFKGIRKRDNTFFKHYKLAPTYLACIKIACKIHDFPILNYELAQVIDYENYSENGSNMAYMEKKFNRAYREILKLYRLIIPNPEHPNFINYACVRLSLPCDFATMIHQKYTLFKKIMKPHFRIEGYILALIYIYGAELFGITLKRLGNEFHVSSITISNRKNEMLKYVQSGS